MTERATDDEGSISITPHLKPLKTKLPPKAEKLLQKYKMELDEDAEEVIRLIVKEGRELKNISKDLFDFDWVMRMELRILYNPDTPIPIKQRIVEFIAEMQGLLPTGAKAMSAVVAQVSLAAIHEG